MLFGKRKKATLSKNHFECPEDQFAHKCLDFSYLKRKKICKFFSLDISKVYLSCPEQHFEETYISWRFFPFWDIDWSFCALWQMKLSEVFKSLFFVSRWSVFSSKSLEKGQVFSFLVLTAKKICDNFLASLSKVYLSSP